MKKLNLPQLVALLYFFLTLIITINCERNFDAITDPGSTILNNENQIMWEWAVYAVIKLDGTLWMWGRNFTGLLGDGTMVDNSTPRQITEIKQAVAMHMSIGHILVADAYGNLWYWGHNDARSYNDIVKKPILISKLPGVVQIDISADNFRLLRNDGTVWLLEWDHKNPRQWLKPSKIHNFNNIIQISRGMLLTKDGMIYYVEPYLMEIENVSQEKNIYNVKQIQNVQNRHILALKNDGTLWSWGNNSGGLNGDSTMIDRENPVRVLNLENVQTISANYGYNLAITSDGTAWYWGYTGKVNNENTYQLFPEKIPRLEHVTHAYASIESILKTNDGLYWSVDMIHQTGFAPHQVFMD